MLLAINANNTRTGIGLFEGEQLVETFSLPTRRESTADELALLFDGALTLKGYSLLEDVDGVAIGSVVPTLTRELRDMVARHLGRPPFVLEPGIRTGIPILIDNPKEMGADRISNAVATVALYEVPAVCVDMGTATTFDAVSSKGELLGCAIAPGLTVAANALTSAGAMLKHVELVQPKALIGKSTVDAIQSGVIFGYASLVQGMIERFRGELGPDMSTIVTGGDADRITPLLDRVDHVDRWLVLKGLRILYGRNHV